MIQSLIHRWEEKAQIKAPVTRLCALLGVSRTGVYAAATRQRQPRPPCAARAAVRAAQACMRPQRGNASRARLVLLAQRCGQHSMPAGVSTAVGASVRHCKHKA